MVKKKRKKVHQATGPIFKNQLTRIKVFFSWPKIVEIMPDFFINLRHLEYLSLRLNNIIGNSGAVLSILFDHILTVKNLIVKIPDICWSNNHLVELDVSYINVYSITGNLEYSWNLKFLNSRDARLSYLDPLIFHDMVSLQVLLSDDVFSSNNMFGKDSGKKFFENNKDLVYLELSRNGIDILHKEVFKNLKSTSFTSLNSIYDHFSCISQNVR